MSKYFHFFIAIFLLLTTGCNDNLKEKIKQDTSFVSMKEKNKISNPLASWNEGKVKKSIIDFVESVTNEENPSFVKEEDRIAVFDNDGTLWTEQPMYTQVMFAFDRIKTLASQHPEWKNKQPFKAVLENDMKTLADGGEKALLEIMSATHIGMTAEEFTQIVKTWIDTARHEHYRRPYTECVYQPMLELLTYLRENGFKTFVVSGGGIEFMRPWSESIYGIPAEQVVGSSVKTKYEVRDGKPVLIRLSEINLTDDKEGKPVGINEHIGKRPIAAFGNSDGGFQMLEWATANKNPHLALIIHHDDAEREFAYDRQSPIGKLERGLDEAPKREWIIVSMKNDWKKIFAWE